MWDGTLSGAEFQFESMALLEQWNNADKGCHWQWQPWADSTAGGYLTLEDVPTPFANDDAGEVLLSSDECDSSGDPADVAALVVDPLSAQHHASLAYHVIYSESYKVPILFFRGHHSDGRLFCLKDFQRILTGHSRQLLESSPWTFLTQEEHPFLHRPWFSLHPCGTSNMMAMILNHGLRSKEDKLEEIKVNSCQSLPSHVECRSSRVSDGGNPVPRIISSPDTVEESLLQYVPSSCTGRYVLTWLSVVGQVARLDVPFDLFKKWSKRSNNVGGL